MQEAKFFTKGVFKFQVTLSTQDKKYKLKIEAR
jgi:hypothetical protein